MINGVCDKRFSRVRDAFAANFENGEEVGASFAVTVNGEYVVDLWAGHADAGLTRPWERDTIVNVWSTGKAVTATCAHMLVDRGLLDIDAPVAKYWPEFAQAGKEKMPVRYLLSHQSGLSVIEKPLPTETFYDWDGMASALAAQKPLWEPGTKPGYQAITFGYLVGEVVRRITGKSLGTFVREEIAGPLGADFHIGLSQEHHARVAEMSLTSRLNLGRCHLMTPRLTFNSSSDNCRATRDNRGPRQYSAMESCRDSSGKWTRERPVRWRG